MGLVSAFRFKLEDFFTKIKISKKIVTVYVQKNDENGTRIIKSHMNDRVLAQAEWSGFFEKQGKFYFSPPETGQEAALYVRTATDTPEKEMIAALHTLPNAIETAEFSKDYTDFDLERFIKIHIAHSYLFDRYKKSSDPKRMIKIISQGFSETDLQSFDHFGTALYFGRDLINTPTEDCSPAILEQAIRSVGEKFSATVQAITGEELLQENFPLIHAVGRAASEADRAPRLIDLVWGNPNAPKLTLVGKGVCYDTGGLDIKTGSSMRLMKKDMGGAASVIALAYRIMAENLPVRLRVTIPAVENAIAGNAYRPGDIYPSRKGLTVEIGDTDAEGRLVLADALAFVDAEAPDLLINIATLTGAARVALGYDMPAMYAKQKQTARNIFDISEKTGDPVWEMPLWKGYDDDIAGKISDLSNISNGNGGPVGSVIGALFLQRFVTETKDWVHFDAYCYNNCAKPGRPAGAELTPYETLFSYIAKRYAKIA